MSEIRVLIVDDHPVVREGLAGILAGQPDFDVVATAANGQEGVTRYAQHRPDVVLMDLRMPVLDGVAAIEQIRQHHPEANILVLTTYDSDADIVRAIEAGATGYLLKDTPRDELFRSIRSVARGESVLAPAVAARLMTLAELKKAGSRPIVRANSSFSLISFGSLTGVGDSRVKKRSGSRA